MHTEFIKCDRDEALFKIDLGKNWNGFSSVFCIMQITILANNTLTLHCQIVNCVQIIFKHLYFGVIVVDTLLLHYKYNHT